MDKGHGRIEKRTIRLTTVLTKTQQWKGLKQGFELTRERTEKGKTTVIQLGYEPKVLAVNVLNDTILATPAIAGGAIYLRSDGMLYCIGEKKEK